MTVVVVRDVLESGWQVQAWDLLLISGLAMFVLGIWLASKAPARFQRCLAELNRRGAIALAEAELGNLVAALELRGDRWARISGLVVALAMAAAFAAVLWEDFQLERAVMGGLQTLMGYVAGGYLGRMASYGRLDRTLQRRGIAIGLNPWHWDRAGGLKPIGDFYFGQAMVVAIPAAFLAIWLLVMQIWPGSYNDWKWAYFGLLSVAIVFEILAFFWPLRSFHLLMARQKRRWRRQIDGRYRVYAVRRKSSAKLGFIEDNELPSETLATIAGRSDAVERMRTWPVDVQLALQFAVNIILLVIPLVLDLLIKDNI